MAEFQVTLHGAIFGCKTQNVFHFRKTQAIQSDMGVLALAFKNQFLNDYIGQMLTNWVANRVHVAEVSGTNWVPIDLFFSQAGSAGNSVFQFPYTAFLVRIGTDVTGPKGRGRFYLPGASAGKVSEGRWLNTVQANFVTLLGNTFTKWCGANPTQGFNLGVRGRGETALFLQATSLQLRDVASMQRRRNIGVGD